jgi:hypothetical protein
MEHTHSRKALIAVDAFARLSALLGMAILLADRPIRFPASWLERTPFGDYTLPALILGLVVGGSALVAMGAMIGRASAGPALSLLAGAIMIGWIAGEVLLLDRAMPATTYWAQAEYLLVGVAMVALALRVAPNGWRGMLPHPHDSARISPSPPSASSPPVA